MNEQIKEFLVKARVQDRGYFIYQYGGATGHQSVEKAIDLEKFAELLIRECMSVIGEENYGMLTGKANCTKIKRHFGVEE